MCYAYLLSSVFQQQRGEQELFCHWTLDRKFLWPAPWGIRPLSVIIAEDQMNEDSGQIVVITMEEKNKYGSQIVIIAEAWMQ